MINELANLINNDSSLNGKLKVAFLENYNVSLAELIIPAANGSEQISLASKEASGTSNMKFMMTGAIPLATLDGANIEIKDEVSNDNIVIFGMDKDDVYRHYERMITIHVVFMKIILLFDVLLTALSMVPFQIFKVKEQKFMNL